MKIDGNRNGRKLFLLITNQHIFYWRMILDKAIVINALKTITLLQSDTIYGQPFSYCCLGGRSNSL